MIRSYEAICFDAGGTLLYPHPSVGEIYQKVSARFGCCATAEQLEKLFREIWLKRDGLSHLKSLSDEKIERTWWRELVLEVFNQVGGIKEFESFFDELYVTFADPNVWRLYPGTVEVLQELKRRHKKLAIISNWDSRLFGLCDGLGIKDYFEFVLASAVVGASKPGPRIFQEALKRFGVDPSQAVHIGDSVEDDIQGAQRVGMQAILIDRHPKHRTQPLPPIHVIQDLMELLS